MTRTEPNWRNLHVQRWEFADLLIRWNNIKDVTLFGKLIYRIAISVLQTVVSNMGICKKQVSHQEDQKAVTCIVRGNKADVKVCFHNGKA